MPVLCGRRDRAQERALIVYLPADPYSGGGYLERAAHRTGSRPEPAAHPLPPRYTAHAASSASVTLTPMEKKGEKRSGTWLLYLTMGKAERDAPAGRGERYGHAA